MRPAPLLLLAALCACRQGGGGEERSLARLERLAFVPAGQVLLERPGRTPLVAALETDLLVDRYEVTRGEWLEWLARRPDGAALSAEEFRERWPGEDASYPATWMTCDEAARFAADEGLRLLGAGEWMRAAAGTRAQRYPWGTAARSVSNSLELALDRPAAVGTFENGRSALGLYDLVGNAAEWVEGTLLGAGAVDPERRTWAMGGSWLDRTRPLFFPEPDEPLGLRFNAALLSRAHRGRDIGLRLCVEAEEWLRRHAGAWPRDEGTRARLRAVGRRWGSAALPLLERLADEPDAPAALDVLLAGARR